MVSSSGLANQGQPISPWLAQLDQQYSLTRLTRLTRLINKWLNHAGLIVLVIYAVSTRLITRLIGRRYAYCTGQVLTKGNPHLG